MKKFTSTNPVFKSVNEARAEGFTTAASFRGIILKTTFLLVLTIAVGIFLFAMNWVNPILLFASGIVGFVAVIVGTMSVRFSKIASIIYALSQSVFLVTLSAFVEEMYPGTIGIALLATIVVFVVILVLYQTKIVAVTSGFIKFMTVVGFSILGLVLVTSISRIFTTTLTDMFFGTSNLSLIIALVMVLWGAFSLVLDFERAKHVVSSGVDKRYEWTVALGFMVTIVFIYVQIIRIILIIASRSSD